MVEFIEVSVCTCCILKAANGECGCVSECPDPTERLVFGGTELGFRQSPCEGCGDTTDGDRFIAFIER